MKLWPSFRDRARRSRTGPKARLLKAEMPQGVVGLYPNDNSIQANIIDNAELSDHRLGSVLGDQGINGLKKEETSAPPGPTPEVKRRASRGEPTSSRNLETGIRRPPATGAIGSGNHRYGLP